MRTNEKRFSVNSRAAKEQISANFKEIRQPNKANSGRNTTVPQLAGSAMFSVQAWKAIARSLKLSGRELQIVRGVFDDQKEATIAVGLGVSAHTIHTHVQRLHRKLGITDRSQLLQLVMQEFLVLTAAPANGLPPICANRTARRCPLDR